MYLLNAKPAIVLRVVSSLYSITKKTEQSLIPPIENQTVEKASMNEGTGNGGRNM